MLRARAVARFGKESLVIASGHHIEALLPLPPEGLRLEAEAADSFKRELREYRDAFGEHLYLAASRTYNGNDAKQLHRIYQLAKQLHMPVVATNDVHYHHAIRRELQDVMICVREKCTIHNVGFRLHSNAERYLKPIDEMLRLFRQYPDALYHTQVIAEACRFSLDELKYQYPKEITSNGRTPQEELTFLAWEGARKLFEEQVPEKEALVILILYFLLIVQ